MKGFVLFAFRESNEILTLMAFPVLKIQFPLLMMCLLAIQRGWGWGVEVVSSVRFLLYRLFSSLFKCRNVFYEVYWQENLTLKLKATNMGSEE